MTRRLTDRERLLRTVTGGELTRELVTTARQLGWLAVHNRPAARQSGRWTTPMIGDPGEPDIRLVRPPEVVFIEVKREVGDDLTPDQIRWRNALVACPGVHYMVCRPSNKDDVIRFLADRVK